MQGDIFNENFMQFERFIVQKVYANDLNHSVSIWMEEWIFKIEYWRRDLHDWKIQSEFHFFY
jgi:hypothetical protein